MNQMERVQAIGRGRQAAALIDDEDSEELENVRRIRQQQLRMGQDGEYLNGEGDPDGGDPDGGPHWNNDYADSKGPLAQWLQKNEVVKYVQYQFESFLKSFRDQQTGQNIYEDRIQTMC